MTPLTKEELDGCYIHYDEYVIACLIKIGLIRAIINNKAKYIKMSDVSFIEDNNKNWVDYEAKLIYFHKGNFYAEPYQEEYELTYGETIKQPFPKMEDIVEDSGILMPSWITRNIKYGLSEDELYEIAKEAYNSGLDVTWQLKQTDPHTEIKAEYEKAKEKYDVVKVFHFWDYIKKPNFRGTVDGYRIKCYNIDWNKLLSWSYANGEFVECEFSDNDLFMTVCANGKLYGVVPLVNNKYQAVLGEDTRYYEYCRLAKGVEIKDEWLTEVKQCQPSQ